MFKIFSCCLFRSVNPKLFTIPQSILPNGLHIARVIDIYDGDTITVSILHHKTNFEYNIRFARIDTPELKYKGLNKKTENNDDPEIKKLKELRAQGQKARDRLIYLISECPNNIVYVDCKGKEKYGRILAEVYPAIASCSGVTCGEKSFNQILLDEKLAKPYDGGNRTIDEP